MPAIVLWNAVIPRVEERQPMTPISVSPGPEWAQPWTPS
jgi:hypothetical protein